MPNHADAEELVDEISSSLSASEERFRLLVEGVQDYAIFMLDPSGVVVSWNAGGRRIKGYEAEEIIGESFKTFYPQEALDRGWPDYELEVAGRVGRFEDEGWRIRKDGSLFWAHVTITALREGGELVGFSKITRDLTERKRHEEALRQSDERFRLLVEGVRDYAIFMLDPEGRIVSWNVGAERIKGYAAHEIIGEHFSRFYPPDAIRRGWPRHELKVAAREGRFEDEGWRLRKDGSQFWANVVITALYAETGELHGFAKVTRDLTERRKVEELEKEGRRINHFLAMLGHELRNPLAPIRNAARVLQESPQSDEKARWASEIIDRQSSHLARIVDDLLDLSRISTGKVGVQREALDLVALVRATAAAMRPVVESKDQELSLEAPNDPIAVLGDATRLNQVLMNLLSNAHKYTPAKGRISVVVERDGEDAQLRVRDDGMGISAGLLPRVFEPFVQGERRLDRSEGGLGIGLSLVKVLVELHDGTVSVTSAGVSQGTEVVVRLPIADRSAARERRSPKASTPSHRILAVDDNADSVESIRMLLELWGHEVVTASDGPSALEAFARHRPDIVLLDIGLPGMTGLEVAERLAKETCWLVAMTGYGQPEDIERAHQAGFHEYLVKPLDAHELEVLLASLTSGRHG